MKAHRNKKLVLIGIIIAVLAFFFWTGSRYPALNDKAIMGNEMPMTGIGFDTLVEVDASDGTVMLIIKNTVNWAYTNKQGMTFGILFAAALLLVFALINTKNLKGRFSNTLLGMVIGAPLGVCTNCAAPIAKGISSAGGRAETSLATMVSSPTLNVVIITMMFTLFPTYFIVIKLLFTLILILVGIPLVTYLFPQTKIVLPTPDEKPNKSFLPVLDLKEELYANTSSWPKAFIWVVKNYFKSLFYLLRTTVPLMLLAGLLGSVMIAYLPFNVLSEVLPMGGAVQIVIAIILLAILGTFLPVPMAFDVIISATLIIGGLHERYAAVLLFTMGAYSIYSHFIVHQSIGWKTALAMFSMVVILGVSAGVTTHYVKTQANIKHLAQLNGFIQNENATANVLRMEGRPAIKPTIEKEDIIPVFFESIQVESADLKVSYSLFNERTAPTGQFKMITGPYKGISEPFEFSSRNMIRPLSMGRGIAAGDINNDGWPDVVFPTEKGIAIYLNSGQKSFFKVSSSLIDVGDVVLVAALVDINNDGWLDLYYSTHNNGNFLSLNEKGVFQEQPMSVTKPIDGRYQISAALGFADLNDNGFLDVFHGNWTGGITSRAIFRTSGNMISYNTEGEFSHVPFESFNGETLSVLISDINNDGNPDILEGNDYKVADQFYLGNEDNGFVLQTKKNSVFEEVTENTMSIAAADIDNDLDFDLYEATTNHKVYPKYLTNDIHKICSTLPDSLDRANCEASLNRAKILYDFYVKQGLSPCPPDYQNDCIAYFLVRSSLKDEGFSLPEESKFKYFVKVIAENKLIESYYDPKDFPDVLNQSKLPVFLNNTDNVSYENQVKIKGLENSGWAWNSKFADLDNDEWQDLFIANGFVPRRRQETNLLFLNSQGEKFVNQTEEKGLTNFLNCSGYTYIDYDLDGDLDILMQPLFSPAILYENELSNNHTIAISLRDYKGNRMGIGSKVIITYGGNSKKEQIREMRASGGYQSFDAPVVSFGLGEYEKVEKIQITWADGSIDTIEQNFLVDRHYKLERE